MIRIDPYRTPIYTADEIDEMLSHIEPSGDTYTKSEIDSMVSGINDDIDTKQGILTAGDNVAISEQNVISATDTVYTAGTGISIDANNVISASGGGGAYSGGRCIDITNDEISLKDFTLVGNLSDVITKSGGNFTVNKDMIIEVVYKQDTGYCSDMFFFPKGYSTSLGSFTFARYPVSIIDGNKAYNYISIYSSNVPTLANSVVSYAKSGFTFTTDGSSVSITSAYTVVNDSYSNLLRAYVRE